MEPFIKKLKTKNNHYIYDVNTNRIFKVDEVVFNIINDIYDLPQNLILAKWQNQYNESCLISSINAVKEVIDKNQAFSPFHPKKIKHPFSKKKIMEKLNNELDRLELEVTQQCNMRCSYCSFSGEFPYMRKHNNKYMSWLVAKKSLDFFLDHTSNSSKSCITFYGGEPLLAFSLIQKCVNYINKKSKKKFYFGITSNGTLFNNNLVKYLNENNFLITVSLDGPKKIHDRYRRLSSGKGTYDIIINNLEKFYHFNRKTYASPSIKFNITISPPYKLNDIKEYFDSICKKNGFLINPFYVNLSGSNIFHKDQITQFNEDHFKQLKKLTNEYRSYLINEEVDSSPFLNIFLGSNLRTFYHRGNFQKLSDFYYPNGTCIPGWENLFIDAIGDFYICEKLTNFYSIGNIYEGMNYKIIFKILDEYCSISTQDCINCWAIRFCKACYHFANKNGVLSLEKKRENCERIKNSLEKDLKFYLEVLEENSKAFDFLKNRILYDSRKKKIRFLQNQKKNEETKIINQFSNNK